MIDKLRIYGSSNGPVSIPGTCNREGAAPLTPVQHGEVINFGESFGVDKLESG